MSRLALDDFLSYEFLSQVKFAPDGSRAAFVASRANRSENKYDADLCVLKNQTERTLVAGTVKSYAWLDEKTLVYAETEPVSDTAPLGCTSVLCVPADGGEPKPFAKIEGICTLEGVLPDGRPVLSRIDYIELEKALEGLEGEARSERIAKYKDDSEVATVFDEYPFWFNGRGVINKTRKTLYVLEPNGALTRITPFGFRTEYVHVRDGIVAYVGVFMDSVEDYMNGVFAWDYAAQKTVCLQEQGVCHCDGITVWNGKVAYVSSKMDVYSVSQCPDLTVADPQTGEKTLLCDYTKEINVGNPVGSDCRLGGGWSLRGDGDWLYFITGVEDASHIWRCDLNGTFEKVFEKDGSVDCFDIFNGRILMVAMHDMRLQELYELKPCEKQAGRVTSRNDAFYTQKPPYIPEPLRFVNKDGVEIHGFVIKPEGYDPQKKYPVVLDIHGGPHLSYGAVYYHEMQYWASLGWFVIYANPRGGEGRGNEFGLLHARFGTIDYDDLMAFCDEALKAYPAMDASRMGVTGGSYGGFMTNWIIGHTDRFCAAAAQRGISNFISMEGTSDIGRLFAEGQIGSRTHTDVAKMWEQSPLKYADNCTTPTLFIHSEEDYRCWLVEALQMYTALINQGVETRLCLFHHENHELSRGGRPKGRVRRLTEITNWMAKHFE